MFKKGQERVDIMQPCNLTTRNIILNYDTIKRGNCKALKSLPFTIRKDQFLKDDFI